MANYVERAVDGMAALLSASLQGELSIVESEAGLGAGDLAMPGIIKHFRPDDNRSPMIQVYDDQGITEGDQRNGLWTVPVIVVLIYESDADIEAGAIHVRRYVTALMRTIVKNETLSGVAYQTNFAGGDALRLQGDTSRTRHLYALSWAVKVHEREAWI